MNLDIKLISCSIITYFLSCSLASANSFEEIIKNSAKNNGLVKPSTLSVEKSQKIFDAGEKLFSSRNLSNSQVISCQDCHLDEFSSADGLPNAVGIGGVGKGTSRIMGGGEVIPRNTLPLWGRGQEGFNTFFWDGKVQVKDSTLISQFGESPPSNDLLEIAVHLPAIEIREMLIETQVVSESKTETISGADAVFSSLIENIIQEDKKLADELANAFGKAPQNLEFIDAAKAIAHFIRVNFQIKDTKFHKFVYENASLSKDELNGAKLFYGKGKCSVCHSGPYFSDLEFHSIPFKQIGFGKNGFGIDYGRYNVTHNPADLYKFRTPPLINVAKTAPYGHSGSVNSLEEAIRSHFDPLKDLDVSSMNSHDRTEYYKKLVASQEALTLIANLNEKEIDDLRSFLETLSF